MKEPDLRDRIERRIAELRAEAKVGHEMLAQLESQQANLQRTLLRIGGAIDALEELMRAPPTLEEDDRNRLLPTNGAPAPSRAAASELR